MSPILPGKGRWLGALGALGGLGAFTGLGALGGWDGKAF